MNAANDRMNELLRRKAGRAPSPEEAPGLSAQEAESVGSADGGETGPDRRPDPNQPTPETMNDRIRDAAGSRKDRGWLR